MPLATNNVTGQFIVGVSDGPDGDDEPDLIPARGTVVFTASVPYLLNLTATPNPVAILHTAITAVLDDKGYLCTPEADDPTKPGRRGIRLIATDDPGVSTTGWTWTATPRFEDENGSRLQGAMEAFSFALPAEGPGVDLTTVIRVPASKGLGTEQAVALLTLAQAEATEAKAAAADVVARADRGEFKGGKGDPGDASTVPGPAGKSAYEVAVAGGYTGTATQWLASLKGAKGDPGLSAYQVAQAGGYAGTQTEWLASLKGAKGDASTVAGPPGKSAYEVAVTAGYTGTQAQWLASLQGATGSAAPPTKNDIFAVRYISGAWEYTTLAAAKTAGLLETQTVWFIGSPNGAAPSWARSGDVVTTS